MFKHLCILVVIWSIMVSQLCAVNSDYDRSLRFHNVMKTVFDWRSYPANDALRHAHKYQRLQTKSIFFSSFKFICVIYFRFLFANRIGTTQLDLT